MNTTHITRVGPAATDLRERTTAAVNTLRAAITHFPVSPRFEAQLDGQHQDAAAAFLLSGVSQTAADPDQFAHELDRHYAMTASHWQQIVEELLLPERFVTELEALEIELGEEFTRYLSFDDARIRERLDEDYVAIETDRGIYLFHRLSHRD